MSFIKRNIPIHILGAALLALPAFSALATNPSPNPTKIQTIIANTTSVVNQLVYLAFTVALLVFAWGIVKFITAASDPAKLQKAKGIIIWGVVGMAVLASIAGIIVFVREYFGIQGNEQQITIPQFKP